MSNVASSEPVESQTLILSVRSLILCCTRLFLSEENLQLGCFVVSRKHRVVGKRYDGQSVLRNCVVLLGDAVRNETVASADRLLFHTRCGLHAAVINSQCTAHRPQ